MVRYPFLKFIKIVGRTHILIRTFCRLTQCEKRFFQALADRAVRLVKNQGLILVEKILSQPVEEMQEMPQESDAIENRDFDAARFVILGTGIFPNVVSHGFSRDEDIILNVPPMRGNFLERTVNVAVLHGRPGYFKSHFPQNDTANFSA